MTEELSVGVAGLSARLEWGGETREIASRNLFAVARFLDVEAEWLAIGEGPATPAEAALGRLAAMPSAEVLEAVRLVMAVPARARTALAAFLAAMVEKG